MAHRRPKKKDFVGKTIKNIIAQSCNQISFLFTDGTQITLEVDYEGIPGLYGIVACNECMTFPKEP